MKYFLLSSLFLIALNCHAEEPDCPEKRSDFVQFVHDSSLPNCSNEENIYNALDGDTSSICQSCKSDFIEKYNSFGKSLYSTPITYEMPKSDKQKKFFDTLILDYKKELTQNLVETLKLRSLPASSGSFEKSLKACKMKEVKDFTEGCSSSTAKKLLADSTLLRDMSQAISNELAKMLTADENFNPRKTLLKRTPNACYVSEKDALYAANSLTEEMLSPDLIKFLENINTSEHPNLESVILSEGFITNFADKKNLATYLKDHPLLASYANSTSQLVSFLKTIPVPQDTNSLRAKLYGQENANDFDKRMAENCTSSFKAIKDAICSPSFENGKIDLNAFENHEKIFNSPLEGTESDIITSQEELSKTADVLKLCHESSQNDLKLSNVAKLVTPSLPSSYLTSPYSSFESLKYAEISSSINNICAQDDKKCENNNSYECKLYRKYKEINIPDSLDNKLANSSNSNVNSLLRSMLGNTNDLDPKTREILVLQGILPKEDGTLVAQAEIPERQPGYFSNPATPSAPAKTAVAPAPVQRSRTSASAAPRDLYDPGTNYKTHVAAMPDFSDLLHESDKNLRDVQDEIMRRLTNLPNGKPANQNQARQIARDSLKSKGITNPSLENALATRLMASPTPTSATPGPGGNQDLFDGKSNEVASSSTQTAAEKYKKDGMNRALADMYGARQSAGALAGGRGPASDSGSSDSEKPLSTVALSVPEDTRISLHQVFAEKLNKNDPETQVLKVLVKNKKDFILQVSNVSFRVVFDQNNKMNILLDSGNKDEAQRIRPQLEIFFNRLRAI